MRCVKSIVIVLLVIATACSEESSSSPETTGQGGSTARYTIQGDYLYVVDDVDLRVFLISDGEFRQVSELAVGFGIETIFSRPDYLYLGANDGMYIYDLSDPELPGFVFRYQHILSCDPVVVQGNRAYVTLSSMAEACNRGLNQLEIIDITDRYNPTLIKAYPMLSPRGLAVDGKYLFVTEGEYGFKVYDITNERDISLVQSLEANAFDVIAGSNLLTVTGHDGVMQYSYPGQGANFLSLLSKIPVERK